MCVLAFDLGGTKLATGVFTAQGDLLYEETLLIGSRTGKDVADLITYQAGKYIYQQQSNHDPVQSIGVSVPGISNRQQGTVWAPNIAGWEAYPLLQELKNVSNQLPVTISGDRNCYIAGEHWKGHAQNCQNAIYIAVGTGIGAGILADSHILNSANDIAGAIGWMALERPYNRTYQASGCFESAASGAGMVAYTKKLLEDNPKYSGPLTAKQFSALTAHDLFNAFAKKDEIAIAVINNCIELWGMAVANLISIFNPEKIIFGGGIFGPAIQFIPAIVQEAKKWAQPVSMQYVSVEASGLGSRAGLYGAAWQALQFNPKSSRHV